MLRKLIRNIQLREKSRLVGLADIVGRTNFSTGESTLNLHSHDESYHRCRTPDCVVFPASTGEVSKIAKYCSANQIPMIPFGLGTGFEGGVTAPSGGVSIDMRRMDKITKVIPSDFVATVQPGVRRIALNEYIRDTGLMFPVDPGADATICGMCSTSASGTSAVRYGTMKENTINLEVVLANGDVIHTAGEGRHFQKSSAGYNLTELFVGSEGTLGIITEATIRLHAIPEHTHAAICTFESIEDCLTCSTMVIENNIPVGRMEFVDARSIQVINQYSGLRNDVKPTLFFEFVGSPYHVEEQIETVKWCAEECQAHDWKDTGDQEERARLWKARHMAYYATLSLCRPGQQGYSTDTCVPQSTLIEMVLAAEKYISESKYINDTAIMIGHVGDGNFHVFGGIDPTEKDEVDDMLLLSSKIVAKALELGGTCTGEHGIGTGKRQFLIDEVGQTTVSLMRQIKSVFDPCNLMNPGKIFIQ